ncbi:hypothetical protein UFOVP84_185 [uncultured Caudovirales phage]|uniref:Uncharacterized protein n=1 Tax=uncultured Caudovirales phage TaxID=2100421 RepID=A0A6J5KY86_9CAUD|nr:hypothetical protein UFOVP84_185 [uncultured Caudovirales phage]
MKKKLLVLSIDIALAILLSSFVYFVSSWVILMIAIPVLLLVSEHYIVMRSCYLENK